MATPERMWPSVGLHLSKNIIHYLEGPLGYTARLYRLASLRAFYGYTSELAANERISLYKGDFPTSLQNLYTLTHTEDVEVLDSRFGHIPSSWKVVFIRGYASDKISVYHM